MKLALAPLLAAVALAACRSSTGPEHPTRWDGNVARWGTVREVLRNGDKSAKVALDEKVIGPAGVGIGALADLAGEIAVVDGVAWVARTQPGGGVSAGLATAGEQAALLFLSQVPAWRGRELKRDLDFVQLEPFLRSMASQAHLDTLEAFPFVIRGRVESLQSHVLAGRCPYAEDTAGAEPVRERHASAQATLVGFYSTLPAGELTHHGSLLHMHVLIEDSPGHVIWLGHVDSVRIPKGALIQVPRPPPAPAPSSSP